MTTSREPIGSDRLSPRSAEIAAKVIDGEAIIINLANGYYYSLEGAGAVVWEGISAQQSLDAIAACLRRRFEVSAEAACEDIKALAADLVREELVSIAEGPQPVVAWGSETPAGREVYVRPVLQKYGDMAHFFALDPPLPDLEQDLAAGGAAV